MRKMGVSMNKIVKIRIKIRPATPVQEAAGRELWRRLAGKTTGNGNQ